MWRLKTLSTQMHPFRKCRTFAPLTAIGCPSGGLQAFLICVIRVISLMFISIHRQFIGAGGRDYAALSHASELYRSIAGLSNVSSILLRLIPSIELSSHVSSSTCLTAPCNLQSSRSFASKPKSKGSADKKAPAAPKEAPSNQTSVFSPAALRRMQDPRHIVARMRDRLPASLPQPPVVDRKKRMDVVVDPKALLSQPELAFLTEIEEMRREAAEEAAAAAIDSKGPSNPPHAPLPPVEGLKGLGLPLSERNITSLLHQSLSEATSPSSLHGSSQPLSRALKERGVEDVGPLPPLSIQQRLPIRPRRRLLRRLGP